MTSALAELVFLKALLEQQIFLLFLKREWLFLRLLNSVFTFSSDTLAGEGKNKTACSFVPPLASVKERSVEVVMYRLSLMQCSLPIQICSVCEVSSDIFGLRNVIQQEWGALPRPSS
jgi:hypothetical protein